MIEERAAQLEAAIAATEAAGGCEQSVANLQRELDAQRKKESAPVSVLTVIQSTKGFITRAEKRHLLIDEQIAELMKQKRIGKTEKCIKSSKKLAT